MNRFHELTDVQLVWELHRIQEEVLPRMKALLENPDASRKEKKAAKKWLKMYEEEHLVDLALTLEALTKESA